jgi:hypothetical protein
MHDPFQPADGPDPCTRAASLFLEPEGMESYTSDGLVAHFQSLGLSEFEGDLGDLQRIANVVCRDGAALFVAIRADNTYVIRPYTLDIIPQNEDDAEHTASIIYFMLAGVQTFWTGATPAFRAWVQQIYRTDSDIRKRVDEISLSAKAADRLPAYRNRIQQVLEGKDPDSLDEE